MTKEYGQFCGLSHALDLIGSRWTLMIVRELLLGPKRYSELENGLPGIPTNVLSARLRELEDDGLVERRLLPRPANSVVYELTEYGHELEEPLLRLGHWGAKSLSVPKSSDYVGSSALTLGLRALFHPEAARGVHTSFEVPGPDFVVQGRIDDGVLTVPSPCPEPPELSIQGDPATMLELFHKRESAANAIAAQRITIDGSLDDAERFFEIFHLD
jgi:DNA-binding HxlR family transcriptional regulator